MQTIPDDIHDINLDIDGLRFEQNIVRELDEDVGWFSHKVLSSPGPLVSDFVTHGPKFKYTTYGIHIGQEDRLTFFGHDLQYIEGHFIDCREESPTRSMRISYRFSPSMYRRLVIPRGVAHTFDGLEGVVTRDEPIWYASEDNPHWNVNNDLVSVLRSKPESAPIVDVCKYRFSDDLHNFMTRLSQSVLEKPKSYHTRFRLNVDGAEQYVMFQENTWNNEGRALQPLLEAGGDTPIRIIPARYAITGKASWTLVPSTSSGVSDVFLMRRFDDLDDIEMHLHRRTRRWYTFLTNEGCALEVQALDLRPPSPTFGETTTFSSVCDPRVSYAVEPGIAHRFRVVQDTYVRAESEVFVSEQEPRSDLPLFGNDIEVIDPASFSRDQPELPSIQCPERVVRLMAWHEASQAS